MMDRLPFEMAQGENPNAMDFFALTVACDVEAPFRGLLLLLADSEPDGRQEECGTSYAQLEEISLASGFDEHESAHWRQIAGRIPLSEHQASHILRRLREKAGTNIFIAILTNNSACTVPDEKGDTFCGHRPQ